MPTTIQGTNRQRLTTRHGVELQRQYIVLPAAVWEKLHEICRTQRQSGSQIVEQMINLASIRGVHSQAQNDRIRSI
jgi:macrodomain Ter protein organizer (MatP/YcbG family)